MKFKARYLYLNQDEVILLRRFFFCWFKYQPFKNKLHKKEVEMNQLRNEFEEVYGQYRQLLADQRAIINDIDLARGEERNYGRIFEADLPLFPFRHQPTPQPSNEYRLFSQAIKFSHGIKGGPSIAEAVAGNGTLAERAGVNGVPVDISYRVSHEKLSSPGEIVGATSLAVRPNRNKQQQNQKGNQQQNNNNSNN